MKKPPITLADLSQLTIRQAAQQSDRSLLSGEITRPGRLWCGQRLSMFINFEKDARGVVTDLDPDAATGVLSVAAQFMDPAIVVGATFPVYDTYLVGKFHLALDENIRWTRMQFVALDAFVEPSETKGWRKWRTLRPKTNNEQMDGS
jgi:hypothetical protein